MARLRQIFENGEKAKDRAGRLRRADWTRRLRDLLAEQVGLFCRDCLLTIILQTLMDLEAEAQTTSLPCSLSRYFFVASGRGNRLRGRSPSSFGLSFVGLEAHAPADRTAPSFALVLALQASFGSSFSMLEW